jgi:hypothetical protein
MYGCKTNYESEKKGYIANGDKVSVFRFPSDPDERKKWIEVVKKVNANLTVSNNTVVCEAHWPKGYPTCRKKGHDRPAAPPSIFPGVPASIVPELPPAPRVTSRTSNHERNTLPDELGAFEKMDRFTFSQLNEELIDNKTRNIRQQPASQLTDTFIFSRLSTSTEFQISSSLCQIR